MQTTLSNVVALTHPFAAVDDFLPVAAHQQSIRKGQYRAVFKWLRLQYYGAPKC